MRKRRNQEADAADPVTGLPAESAARKSLRAAAGGESALAVLFYVRNMPAISDIANQTLVLASQHLAIRMIRENDTLFRWSGPAFVAVLNDQRSLRQVESEMHRFLAVPLNQIFQTAQYAVHLTVRMTGEVLDLSALTYPQALERISDFMAQAAV